MNVAQKKPKPAWLKWVALAGGVGVAAALASASGEKKQEDEGAGGQRGIVPPSSGSVRGMVQGLANPDFTLVSREGNFGPYRFQINIPQSWSEQAVEYSVGGMGHQAFIFQNQNTYAASPDGPFDIEGAIRRGVQESIQVDFIDLDLAGFSVDTIIALQEEALVGAIEGIEIRESAPSSFGPYREAYRVTIAYPDPVSGETVVQYGYFAIVDGHLGVNVSAVGPESNWGAFRSLYDEALASFRVVAIQ